MCRSVIRCYSPATRSQAERGPPHHNRSHHPRSLSSRPRLTPCVGLGILSSYPVCSFACFSPFLLSARGHVLRGRTPPFSGLCPVSSQFRAHIELPVCEEIMLRFPCGHLPRAWGIWEAFQERWHLIRVSKAEWNFWVDNCQGPEEAVSLDGCPES